MAQGAIPTVRTLDRFSGGMGQADRPTLDEALERIADEEAVRGEGFGTRSKLMRLATMGAEDLSGFLTSEGLAELGQKAVDDYERDKADRKEWADVAE